MRAVIDTNVLLVANGQHADVSPECVEECITRLLQMQSSGITVIDDGYRILREYQQKTSIHPAKSVGDVFLKWLLQHSGTNKVEQVSLNQTGEDCFLEFPDPILEPLFDAPDRKFAAVAHAHPHSPSIWQAADCKWIDWWPSLLACGIRVEFLCASDACRFYSNKFPNKPLPELPV